MSPGFDRSVPVIVVGPSTTALSCIRCVHRAGFSAYGACGDNVWPAKTRFFRKLPGKGRDVWRGQLGIEGHRYLEDLPFEKAVLMPATDDAALWQSDLPAGLQRRFRVSSSSVETLSALQDKSSFADEVAALGIPAPWTARVDSPDDVEAIPFGRLASVFLKPTDSQAFYREFGEKAFWIRDTGEARRILEDAVSRGLSLVAQEYVPGGSDDHFFIDGFRARDGTVSAKMARRRLRIYPPDFGNSCYCESIPFAQVEGAWEGLERLLDHVAYRGIFSAEFKRDARDGVFRILEINTRPWVYVEFAERCGMNMCGLYIADALDQPVDTIEDYAQPKGCLNLYHDIACLRETKGAGKLRLTTVIGQWIRSFKLLFSFTDPGPVIAFFRQLVSAQWSKLREKADRSR